MNRIYDSTSTSTGFQNLFIIVHTTGQHNQPVGYFWRCCKKLEVLL